MDQPQTNVNVNSAPYYRGLTDEQGRLIHWTSLEILEGTGVLLYYQPAINLFQKAGCPVEGNRVRILTSSCPCSFPAIRRLQQKCGRWR